MSLKLSRKRPSGTSGGDRSGGTAAHGRGQAIEHLGRGGRIDAGIGDALAVGELAEVGADLLVAGHQMAWAATSAWRR